LIQPSISQLPLWEDHVESVNEVFSLALELLRDTPNLPRKEVPLTRELCRCVKRANSHLWTRGRGIWWSVVAYECPNGPDAEDEIPRGYEKKCPDFKWGVVDIHQTDPSTRDMILDIECKRLGKQAGWELNQNYVFNGVRRFRTTEHSYGRNVACATMIGYVQNMEIADVFEEVNGHSLSDGAPPLTLSPDGWQAGAISKLRNEFDRPYNKTPFCLSHMWLDLRSHYQKA
jgi:hypothetical protein